MVITLLGTGTGIPSPHRNPPCIFMRFSDKRAILDSGPGTLKKVLRVGVDHQNLDFIFYTHLHLDHVSEFAAILFATNIPPATRKKSLTVYGPIGLKDYYRKLGELYSETIYPDSYELNLEEIENRTIFIDDFTISTRTLKHHGGGMGYRIVTPGGKVAVYTGDTDYCQEVVELSRDADLLILECSFPDEMKAEGHLTPTAAGKIAYQSNVKKLVFVHMYPICEQYDLISPCRKEFGGEILVGEDLMEFVLM